MRRELRCILLGLMILIPASGLFARALHKQGLQYITKEKSGASFEIAAGGKAAPIYVDPADQPGVLRAVTSLAGDIANVSGARPKVVQKVKAPKGAILVGTLGSSKLIDQLVDAGKLDVSAINGKWEAYIIQTVDGNLVIAGSDRRGTIYGVYDVSENIGVSPWYWWADVPVSKSPSLFVSEGRYLQDSPKVQYRGIFLNDEAPCLTGWVKNYYGTDFGGRDFYERVFELILRLKGNYLWPAMWGWAFYADDPMNSNLAHEMGVVIGTSHHEPMARNHQEWVRNRDGNGVWNYKTNQERIDEFFREGIERVKGKDDIITIGMRGDGDEAMSDETDVQLLERIVRNQRAIIEDVTGRPASETPQLWALYKEVLDYYDNGMRVPDDVIILLCDDNWGNVRRLPNAEERKHPGGWGLYYHVDYVGAPRNTKWLNVTPVQNMWEQLQLTYDYGVDKLWVLNVGDLKPMEYPITLFLDMAWDPKSYTVDNLLDHVYNFCAQQFGADQAQEAARILNLYSKYAGRVTPEMLDRRTYNLETGEWKQVVDEFIKLEAEALRQYLTLKPEYRDAYKQIILYPVQALANLYEMYYSQAMNHKLYAENNPAANFWADNVERTFKRDAELGYDYNKVMSGGKWDGMMTQKKIGYTTWNDNFPADKLPEIYRISEPEKAVGSYVFEPSNGYVAIEAEHYFKAVNAPETEWTCIPYMGRTLSGMALMPYTKNTDGAALSYKMKLPEGVTKVTVRVVVKSTLAFRNLDGHRYNVALDGGEAVTVNFNSDLNEKPENIYSVFYPTVASRVVEKKVELDVPASEDGTHILTLSPLDPGIVFEKIVVDFGGYKPSYLFMNESPSKREL
ncbi:glycosyl hydrolase 115 family protein [Xiashengella succiniciproducens]|uniref:Glycosyl hydrolase 115 family protein n=1 Tax=Xiashengella succiniciproducens TaxID=2949635 RepID=A0A9J6ZMT0_9BACT|nr:glycosyl hydrolase 115 family protein [Alkaliflexus sp. Ai-910]URW79194.1 glycosyl hydrolase 115 family protein [Alkaliflexus sp. Ai-910]